MFITVIALICLVVVVWAVWPLIRTKKDVSPDLQSVNSKLLETQIAELDVDLDQGVIKKEQYDAARLDLQRTFLETATVSDIQPFTREIRSFSDCIHCCCIANQCLFYL